MKLRNKKTGEIGRLYFDHQLIDPKTGTYAIVIQHRDKLGYEAFANYFTLAELNAEWEDYKPAEPLIKDAGMREVLRLWAKVNLIPSNATTIEYHLAETLTGTETEFWDNNLHIMFYGNIAPNAVHGKIYTIAELCGEEDE